MFLRIVLAQTTPTAVPATDGGGGSLDIWAIVTGLGVLAGLLAAIFQVVDYAVKWRHEARKRATPPAEAPAAPAGTPEVVPVTVPEVASPATLLTNLPAASTPLVGREKERAAVTDLINSEDVRLVTLTGPGGTGKTRLGLQVATDLLEKYADGVWYVDLAPIRDPSIVLPTIAGVLGIKEHEGVPLISALSEKLRDKRMLLLVDNFEQVIDAAPHLARMLAAVPEVDAIVTSRTLLRIALEHEFPVPPLELPDLKRLPRLELLSKYEAIELFVQRAAAVKPYFSLNNENAPAVAEICVRLDGLPLAIELAAARIKLLTPHALLERLSSRMAILTGGARDLPARQQTLRAAIDWSHDLLDEAEKTIFRRFSVFAGNCTMNAMEAVAGGNDSLIQLTALPNRPVVAPLSMSAPQVPILDGLLSMVEKSLVRQEEGPDGEPRFYMLETIREYASEQLADSGEAGALQQRHAVYYLALAEAADPRLYGPERAKWLQALEADHDNLRAALAWSHDAGGSPEVELRLVGALGTFWQARGFVTQGREHLQRAIDREGGQEKSQPVAKAMLVAGRLAFVQSDYSAARAYYEQSRNLFRQLGNERGVAASLDGLGNVATLQGDYATARASYEENLARWREAGDKLGIHSSINNLAIVATYQEDYATARALLEESLAHLRELGDKERVALALNNLGNVAFAQGDYEAALKLYDESLGLERQLGNKVGLGRALGNWGKAALRRGKIRDAQPALQESLCLRVELGDRLGMGKCLAALAELYALQGDGMQAARLLGAADALLNSTGSLLDPTDYSEFERNQVAVRERVTGESLSEPWQAGKAAPIELARSLCSSS